MGGMTGRGAWRTAAALLTGALMLTACASGEEPGQQQPAGPRTEPSLQFQGPNGETPQALDQLALTDDETERVRAGGYTAAFVWHESSSLVAATEKGAREEFERLGVQVVASTEAGFDPARQADNLQSVLALEPDIIVTIAVDPTSAAAAFRPAVDRGVKLAVMTTAPAGYRSGQEIVSIVTGALTEYGRENAEMLGAAIGEQGKVGYLYHEADFWFTNQRDQAFKDWTAFLHPGIEIVEEQGFSDPARTEEIANAMIVRNPGITGIYVAWATAAEGVLAALRQAGRTDVKVVTNDLEANLAADMARDGNVVGVVSNSSVKLGRGLAVVGAYGVLGKQAPELVANPPFAVTKANLREGWEADYGEQPPAGVLP
jgi:ribose transport system substrate-binding protein